MIRFMKDRKQRHRKCGIAVCGAVDHSFLDQATTDWRDALHLDDLVEEDGFANATAESCVQGDLPLRAQE
jgi:hypothetical protein